MADAGARANWSLRERQTGRRPSASVPHSDPALLRSLVGRLHPFSAQRQFHERTTAQTSFGSTGSKSGMSARSTTGDKQNHPPPHCDEDQGKGSAVLSAAAAPDTARSADPLPWSSSQWGGGWF